MASKSSARDWERVLRIGVYSVSSPRAYEQAAVEGLQAASDLLKSSNILVPILSEIKALHKVAFGSIHPWAGTFRIEGQEVRAGKLICSNASEISSELTALNKEMLYNPLKGSKKYLSEVLGFYHASFLAVHPFLDGNGRLSRTILDTQSVKLLGHSLSTTFSRDEYTEALVRAQEYGDLTKLSKLIRSGGEKRSITVDAPQKKLEKKGEHKDLLKKELSKREKELLSLRRKLGFIGTDIDAQYGLGGFPKGGSELHRERELVSKELLDVQKDLLRLEKSGAIRERISRDLSSK